MSKVLTYINLQLKFNLSDNSVTKKGKIISLLLSICVFIVLCALMFLLVNTLVSSLDSSISLKSISILFVFIVELILTVLAISIQIKTMFKQFDTLITARLPISNFQLYVSCLIIGYINISIYSLTSFIPIMIIYGLASHIAMPEFYGLVFLGAFFAPMIPYGIASLVSVPIMYVFSLLENRNIIKLLLFICGIIVFFFLYDYVLQTLADYLMYQQINPENLNVWSKIILALDSKYNPFTYLRDILFIDSLAKGAVITIIISAVCFIIGLCICLPTFNYVKLRTVEGSQNVFSRGTKYTNDKPLMALFIKEFKEIIRTKVYAYFYLGIAVATPVMVYFCDRLMVQVGQAQLGPSIILGASVLVLTAFMGLINAFAASSINKEGDRFYITKIIPIKFRQQLLIKGLVNFLVSIGALVISCFVIVDLKFVTLEEMFVIFFGEIFMALNMIFMGFNINLASTTFKSKANGDVDEGNVTIVTIIALFISAVLAVSTMFICYFAQKEFAYIPILLVPFIGMIINMLVFFLTVEKKYYRIEVKL